MNEIIDILLCYVIPFILGMIFCMFIVERKEPKDETHGDLYVENFGDSPQIYMQLGIDIDKLRSLNHVNLKINLVEEKKFATKTSS